MAGRMRAHPTSPTHEHPDAKRGNNMLEQYEQEIKQNPRLLLQAIAEFGTMQDIAKLCDQLQGIDIDAAAQAAAEQQYMRDSDLCERYESDQFYHNLGWERAA